jgi:hypothetical protein
VLSMAADGRREWDSHDSAVAGTGPQGAAAVRGTASGVVSSKSSTSNSGKEQHQKRQEHQVHRVV